MQLHHDSESGLPSFHPYRLRNPYGKMRLLDRAPKRVFRSRPHEKDVPAGRWVDPEEKNVVQPLSLRTALVRDFLHRQFGNFLHNLVVQAVSWRILRHLRKHLGLSGKPGVGASPDLFRHYQVDNEERHERSCGKRQRGPQRDPPGGGCASIIRHVSTRSPHRGWCESGVCDRRGQLCCAIDKCARLPHWLPDQNAYAIHGRGSWSE